MRITAVAFESEHGRCTAIATLDNGAVERLFTFYADELRFTEAELVGLTVEQARALRHTRDVTYLQG